MNVLLKVLKADLEKTLDIAYNLSSEGHNIYAEGENVSFFNKNFIATSVFNDEINIDFILSSNV